MSTYHTGIAVMAGIQASVVGTAIAIGLYWHDAMNSLEVALCYFGLAYAWLGCLASAPLAQKICAPPQR